MSYERVFHSAAHFKPAKGEPLRTVMCESAEAVIVAWHVDPGQRIPSHRHPHGQDTWTVLSGRGLYVVDEQGSTRAITAGDVAVAATGLIHGVFNDGSEPLRFISVVSPGAAGYERLSAL
jgi:quercetin dioxygenase-like cupin family protein